MGGRVAAGTPALLLAALLVLVDLAAPARAADRKDDGPSPGPRPATEAEVRVAVDWEHRNDLAFEYLLTNWPAPLEYPYDGDHVGEIGGCADPMPPLVLPESLTSYHLRERPYFLVVTSQGVCSTHDYFEQYAKVEEIGQTVTVWATVEYWAPGHSAPYRSEKLGPIDAPIFAQESDHRPYRRTLSAGISVPSAEEALTEAAARAARPVDDDEPAELPPLDPRIGLTEAGAPPASYDEEVPVQAKDPAQETGTAEAAGRAESTAADQPEQALSAGGYVHIARLLWGIAILPADL